MSPRNLKAATIELIEAVNVIMKNQPLAMRLSNIEEEKYIETSYH